MSACVRVCQTEREGALERESFRERGRLCTIHAPSFSRQAELSTRGEPLSLEEASPRAGALPLVSPRRRLALMRPEVLSPMTLLPRPSEQNLASADLILEDASTQEAASPLAGALTLVSPQSCRGCRADFLRLSARQTPAS